MSDKASPRRALSRLRGNKGASISTTSLASGSGNDGGDDALESGSGGGLLDRLKKRGASSRRSSKDDGAGANAGRLSSMMARRKRGSKQEDSDSLERRLSALSGDLAGSGLAIPANRSETSLPDDSGRSSLMTDENSDGEGQPVRRPTLSPHQSHAGLLTLSSPELHAQLQSVSTESISANSSSSEALRSTASIPHVVEPGDTEPFPTISPVTTIDRAPSPAGKSVGAFKLPGKQANGDTDSVKSGKGGTGGLGGLFRPKSRRNSVASQVEAKPDEATSAADPDISVPDLQVQRETPTKSQERPETPKQPTRGRTRINTNTLPATPPNLVETPTTLVTPPTPSNPNADSGTFPNARRAETSSSEASPPGKALSSVESIRHRRAQSAKLPSKLSNAIALPLTLTVEEAKTPGGTLTQPTSATGFFSSFITAASKAADQLQQNINTINKTKPGSPGLEEEQGGEEVISGAESLSTSAEAEERQPAVDTLGTGDLNLSHLGISENPSPMSSTVTLPQSAQSQGAGTSTVQKAEEEAAARAVSVAYEKP
ncbi:hypothetical protein LTR53_017365, partial [Teratosphaeriaceae sp. CCFEE 6253]